MESKATFPEIVHYMASIDVLLGKEFHSQIGLVDIKLN